MIRELSYDDRQELGCVFIHKTVVSITVYVRGGAKIVKNAMYKIKNIQYIIVQTIQFTGLNAHVPFS